MEKGYSEIKTDKSSVIVLYFPFESFTPYKFLSDILNILDPITRRITIIGGNCDRLTPDKPAGIHIIDVNISMHYVQTSRHKVISMISWFFKAVLFQIRATAALLSVKDEDSIILFYMAYPHFLLPLFTAKIFGKRTIEIVTRSKKTTGVMKILALQDMFLFKLLDGIAPESKSLISDLDLGKYRRKIVDCGSRYVDTSKYYISTSLHNRKCIIAYLGRLNRDKGVLNFIGAIPSIHRSRRESEFLIIGSGDILEDVKNKCSILQKEYNIPITVTGFVPEPDLPGYYNRIKLLVVPTSHSEGLPTVILEAMATGTPVLASDRGAIRDLIEEGITGYILPDNTPLEIAHKVDMIFTNDDLDSIARAAHKKIQKQYSYTAAVTRYRNILYGN